jgi:hypothetical protein
MCLIIICSSILFEFLMFLDHTQLRTAVGMTPLDKWSARYRVLYLTTHVTPATDKYPRRRWDSNSKILAGKSLQNHAQDRANTGTGIINRLSEEINSWIISENICCHSFWNLFSLLASLAETYDLCAYRLRIKLGDNITGENLSYSGAE